MRTAILALAVILTTAVLGFAEPTNHAFVADMDSDVCVKAFGPESIQKWGNRLYKERTLDGGVLQKLYIVKVTKTQYDAGWAALPGAVKTAAKDAAKAESDDFEKWSAEQQAIIEALREEINVLRTHAAIGLPSISKGQMKQKVKDKKP